MIQHGEGSLDHVVLYDATCGLCNRWVRWMIQLQLKQGVKRVYMAPLGGHVSQQLGVWSASHDRVVYVRLGESAEGSTAVIGVLSTLWGPKWWLTWVLKVPLPWREAWYRWVARGRRWVRACRPLTEMEKWYLLD